MAEVLGSGAGGRRPPGILTDSIFWDYCCGICHKSWAVGLRHAYVIPPALCLCRVPVSRVQTEQSRGGAPACLRASGLGQPPICCEGSSLTKPSAAKLNTGNIVGQYRQLLNTELQGSAPVCCGAGSPAFHQLLASWHAFLCCRISLKFFLCKRVNEPLSQEGHEANEHYRGRVMGSYRRDSPEFNI